MMNPGPPIKAILSNQEYGDPYDLLCPAFFEKSLRSNHVSSKPKCSNVGVFFEMILFLTKTKYFKPFKVNYIDSNLTDTLQIGTRTWNGNILDLIKRRAHFTPPYYAADYHRSRVIDFIDTPSIFQKYAIYENPRSYDAPEILDTFSYSVGSLLVLVDVVVAVIIVASRLLIEKMKTGTITTKVLLVLDAIYSISFLQKKPHCWKTWSQRMLITIWSMMISFVMMVRIKSHFVRSITTAGQVNIHHWRDVSNFVSKKGYKLLLVTAGPAAISIETSLDHTMTMLRKTLLEHPAIYFSGLTPLMKYMSDHPGTLASDFELAGNAFRGKIQNLRAHVLTDHSGVFFSTGVRKNSSILLRRAFTKAHSIMAQSGINENMLKRYNLELSRIKKEYRDLFPNVAIGLVHCAIFCIGIAVSAIIFALEKKHKY